MRWRWGMACLGFAVLCACDPTIVPAPKRTLASDASTPVGDTADVALPQDATAAGCPGAAGCSCSADADCGLAPCLAGTCAEPCPELGCGPGRACGTFAGGRFCTDLRGHLCDPCTTSTTCAVPGLPGAACVDRGEAGAFCGAPCRGDLDCGAGYLCQVVEARDGGTSQQCVKASGDCTCSETAVKLELSTICRLGACIGTRTCGAGGLSACSATAAKAETCNGTDDDCDGVPDDGTCDDGNPCTADTCLGAAGCKHEPGDGACTDGNPCTVGDACLAGACVPGGAKSCDDGNACTKDSCDGGGNCVAAVLTGPCSDGNACTTDDTCKAGVCLPGAWTTCSDDNPCTADACDPAAGCSSKAVDGGPCNDKDPCTVFDACLGGACAGKANDCNDGNPCTSADCESGKGCKFEALSGPCDDGDLCTKGESCSAGKCGGAQPVACAAPSDCVLAYCSPLSGGCAFKPKPNSTPCSDGSACTTTDNCKAGACKGSVLDCNDNNPCTNDSCDASKGCTHLAGGGSCSDGDACTASDACVSGKCAGKPVTCDDGKACTTDTCSKTAGCQSAPASGGSCDDGNPCTGGDSCDKGACVGGGNTCICTVDADCASEDDGNKCNGTLACVAGTCTVKTGSVVNCATTGDTACAKATCDPATGQCAPQPVKDGTACEDGSSCTTGDACASGKCTGSAADCNDNDACTDDACGVAGCSHTANTAPCDADGNACTVDACADGACVPGAAKNCDDGDACTIDSCDKVAGCQHQAPAPAAVTTFAGSGTAGFANGTGTAANFHFADLDSGARGGIALGSDGSLYLADTSNHRIRKVKPDGTVTTLAGSGAGGTGGVKEGAGAQANFWMPSGVVVWADGTVYVADRFNQRIRRVLADGVVSTLAGSAPPPDFLAPKATGGFVDGKGAAASFDEPLGLCSDGSALYVTEAGNHAVRRVALDGTVTTLAGVGSAGFADGKGAAAQFSQPSGCAVLAGVLYVADTGNHRIRAIAADGTVTTFAGTGSQGLGNGALGDASFHQPWGISAGGDGALYVADALNHAIRKLAQGKVTTVAGTGSQGYKDGAPSAALFFEPTGVAWVAVGKWYLLDARNHRIRLLNDPSAACQ
jgi:hypothetical protein